VTLKYAEKLGELGTPTALISDTSTSSEDVFRLLREGLIIGVLPLLNLDNVIRCLEQFRTAKVIPNTIARFETTDKKGVPRNREIEDQEKFWKSVKRNLGPLKRKRNISWQEYSDLFRSLIPPCATKVVLKECKKGRSGAALYRATVSFGDGPVKEDLAIKYGDLSLINREASRYTRYVGPLPDGAAAQLRFRSQSRSLGAIAYSWVGDSIEDGIPMALVDAEGLVNWKRSRNVINSLFSTSLDSWYRVYRSKLVKEKSLIPLYDYYTGKNGIQLDIQKLENLPDTSLGGDLGINRISDRHWLFYGIKRTLITNPVQWIQKRYSGELKLYHLSPCHGDLHVRNIYLLPDDTPRLIDFGETGLGHVYRDFAALEVSLRLTCIKESDVHRLAELEDTLCAVDGLGQHLDFRKFHEDQNYDNSMLDSAALKVKKSRDKELQEVCRTIMKIRREAFDASGPQRNQKERWIAMIKYLFAVVMHMLRYATGKADESDDKKREDVRVWHAHYSAAKTAQTAEKLMNNLLSN